MASGFLVAFLGALQASLSVLLTIFAGLIASNFNWLSPRSAKDISRTCVRLFLPALVIKEVGSNLNADTAHRYLPVLAWAIIYNGFSIALGKLVGRWFSFPDWTTAAIAFNNTTSLPLLLMQSLETTGVLSAILMGADDTTSAAVARAKSYFLVSSIVSNCLTFALGPSLLDPEGEDSPDDDEKTSEEDGNMQADRDHERPTEETSLLPGSIRKPPKRLYGRLSDNLQELKSKMHPRVQGALDFSLSFVNGPLISAVVGAIIGLIPPLHRLFFAQMQDGGYFNAWLTSAISSVGELFTALQVIVVGLKLGQSIRKKKAGEDTGHVPLRMVTLVTFIRFIMWPLISIPLVWVLASRTSLLGHDPMLWFTLMLMPAGPPALKLTALADVNHSPTEEKLMIARFLAISYLISPLMCLPVVGSLKAAEAAIR